MTRICTVEGCDRRTAARSYCEAHYTRFQRYGDVLADKPINPPTWGENKISPAVIAPRYLDSTRPAPGESDHEWARRVVQSWRSNVMAFSKPRYSPFGQDRART